MPGQQVGQVFGPNMPSRIAGTAQLVLEPGEVAPSLPWYQPLVPFYPPNISNGSGSNTSSATTTEDGHMIWQNTPARCDLLFYQGDDVLIPLYFHNNAWMINLPVVEPLVDLSSHEWESQIRVLHRYQSKLIAEFSVAATYDPVDGEDTDYTKVELFLPRTDNTTFGQFHWDLYSKVDVDLSRFPKPDGVENKDWPPPAALHTWLYGQVTIVPRVTSTDVLPGGYPGYPQVPWPGPPPDVTVITTGGWCVGPNGRVP